MIRLVTKLGQDDYWSVKEICKVFGPTQKPHIGPPRTKFRPLHFVTVTSVSRFTFCPLASLACRPKWRRCLHPLLHPSKSSPQLPLNQMSRHISEAKTWANMRRSDCRKWTRTVAEPRFTQWVITFSGTCPKWPEERFTWWSVAPEETDFQECERMEEVSANTWTWAMSDKTVLLRAPFNSDTPTKAKGKCLQLVQNPWRKVSQTGKCRSAHPVSIKDGVGGTRKGVTAAKNHPWLPPVLVNLFCNGKTHHQCTCSPPRAGARPQSAYLH